MSKKLFLLMIVIITVFLLNSNLIKADEEQVNVIYFYSPTCSSCYNLNEYFDYLIEKYTNLNLIKLNIADLKNKSLLDEYNKTYNVSEEDEGIIPVIFCKDTYLTGEKEIKEHLENLINRNDGLQTIIIQDISENHEADIKKFMNFTILGIFVAGLVNGLNPCSISMLLFFISLFMIKKVNIIKISFSFCLGKFFTYLLLGTILFNLLSKIEMSWINTTLKLITLIVILILIIMNILDFFAAKKEQYNKIRLQLPTTFRRINHNIIKMASNIANINIIPLVSFLLAIFISLGEFLCTGQIYLATIITVLQTNKEFSFQAFMYLIIYDLAFIIPLLMLSFLIYKGKEVFDVSEIIRGKLHFIKLINVCILIILGIIIIFN